MEFNTKGKKNCDTHASFIRKIRQWRPDSCSCRTSKNFIPNVGFIERNQLQVLEVLPRNNKIVSIGSVSVKIVPALL